MSFRFKQFSIDDGRCAMKVGTDGVLLGAWVRVDGVSTAVDLGAGSGLVSLMAAQRSPGLKVCAVELDAGAYADCQANFRASPWAVRLRAVHADALAYAPEAPVDLVASNPPFFTEELHSPDAARAWARHAGALSPKTAIEWAARWLSADGSVALVLPFGDADEAIYVAEMARLKEQRRLDISHRTGSAPIRTLLQLGRRDCCPERRAMAIRNAQGGYTDEYRRLTSPFYLNF